MPKFSHYAIVSFVSVLSLLAIGGLFILKNSPSLTKIENSSTVVESTATPIILPTDTPSPTNTPAPTATPKPTLLPTKTPQPTAKPVSGPPGSGLSGVTVATQRGNFKAVIMSFDTSNTKMITDTAQDNDCSNDCQTMALKDFVSRNAGFAGVNGTYFCPDTYPDCQSKKNSFDFPVYNTRLNKWIQADKLGWNNRRAIFYTDGSGAHYQHDSAGFGGGLNAGVINYPGLLDGGNVQIDDNQSGLSDKQKAKGTKVGIGTRNPGNIMVVMAYNVDMVDFAHVFKSLGATGALNLDTGGSTALIWGGKYIAGPGRGLPNAIVFANK